MDQFDNGSTDLFDKTMAFIVEQFEPERFKCFPDQKPVCRFQRFFDDNLTQFNPEWIEIQVFEHF